MSAVHSISTTITTESRLNVSYRTCMYFTDLSIATPSSPTPPPSGVLSVGAIAGAVIAVIVIMAVLAVVVVVMVFVIYRKLKGLCLFRKPQVVFYLLLGYCKKSKSNIEPLVVGYSK